MARVTFSATASLTGNTLSGVAHTFGARAKQGSGYVEFTPGSFNKALRKADIRAFINHNTDLLLGRQSNGTVNVSAKADGLHYDIELPDTTYAADLKVLIDRGDLNEMSFGITPGKYETRRVDGALVTFHTEVADIFDISPVSLPAFGGTTVQLHSQRNDNMNLSETLAAMDALKVSEGEAMSDEAIAQFKQYEADVARFNESDAIRQRMADLRKPVVGFPAVIKATPKGDDAEMFAFTQYLRSGVVNADMTFAQTVGSDSGGGYTVPSGFRSKIVERLMAFGGIRGLAETLDTGNGIPLEWPTNDDTSTLPAGTRTDAAFRADIVAEGAASIVGADVAFGTKTLGAYRYAATGTGNVPIKVSVELLQDSAFDIAGFVASKIGERIGRKQAYDLAMGTGSGMPEGLFDQSLHAGDVATASGSVPTYAKLNELVHKVDPAYRQLGNCRFIMNDTTMMVLENITDATLGRPLLLPAQGSIAGAIPSGTLLGFPVTVDQAVPALANNVNGIAFGDFRKAFVVRNVRDVQILVNPYAATGYVVYDGWARMDSVIQDNYAYATMEGLS